MSGQAYSHLIYHQTVLYFQKFGSGPKVLLAFHGYGQTSSAFEEIGQTLKTQYTIYSFDLFFHGKSKWPFQGKALKKELWLRLIQNFLTSHNIHKFSLACYSLGSKFLLAILEGLPSQVEGIVFIAPDGIKTNAWYNLATYPIFFRALFRLIIYFPQPLFGLMYLLLKLKIMRPRLIKFARFQMNSKAKRKRVYYSWVAFRSLNYDMNTIAGLINHHCIHTKMVLGKHDNIITLENMQVLLEKLEDYDLVTLETGHNLLLEKFAGYLRDNSLTFP